MHFLEQDVKWAGIDFDWAERFLVGENFAKTNLSKSVSYNIVRYKGSGIDIIAVGNRSNSAKFELFSNGSVEKVLSEAVAKPVGEYPVIVGVNRTGTVSFNFVVKDKEWLRSNAKEFGELLGDVFSIVGIAAVTDVEPYELFKRQLDTGYRSVNSLYVPTHDGVPALWLTDGSTGSKVAVNQTPVSDGFSTSDIKHFFSLAKKYEQADKLREAVIKLPGAKEVVFMYNSHYQHFNGSLAYNVLLYPMFVKMWEDCCTEGDFEQAYNNWEMWHKTGGVSEAVFIKKEDKKVTNCETTASTSEGLGEWKHVEHQENYQHFLPEKLCAVDVDKLSAQLIQMCIIGKTQTPKIEVYNEGNNCLDTFEFVPEGDTKIVGHGFEVATLLVQAVEKEGIDVNKAYVTK